MPVIWLERLKRMSTTKKERHHVLPRSRGGSDDPSNILVISERGHMSFHSLFGHKTLLEAACELRKHNSVTEAFENDFCNTDLFRTAYQFVFGNKNFLEAAIFLEEIDRKLKQGSLNDRKQSGHGKVWKTRILRIRQSTGRVS